MFNKIRQSNYLQLGQYFFLGIILAVFVYQFVTQSLLSNHFNFKILFARATMIQIFACVVGGIAGGIGYILISLNDKSRVRREYNNWEKMKDSKISLIVLKAMFVFSVGAFSFMLIREAMNLESYTHIMRSLFSSENIISYIGAVLAACVLAIPLSIGAMKRLKSLHNN